jgi:hypothetical protein
VTGRWKVLLSSDGFADLAAEAIERLRREMAYARRAVERAEWARILEARPLGMALVQRGPVYVHLDDLAARLGIPAALVAEWQEAERYEDGAIPLMPSPPLVIPFWAPQQPRALPPPGTRMKWRPEDIRRQAAIDARQVVYKNACAVFMENHPEAVVHQHFESRGGE